MARHEEGLSVIAKRQTNSTRVLLYVLLLLQLVQIGLTIHGQR